MEYWRLAKVIVDEKALRYSWDVSWEPSNAQKLHLDHLLGLATVLKLHLDHLSEFATVLILDQFTFNSRSNVAGCDR